MNNDIKRGIKLRAWDIEREEMITDFGSDEHIWGIDSEGDIEVMTLQIIDTCPGGIGHHQEEKFMATPVIIMQRAPIKDCTGTYVYEGDLIINTITKRCYQVKLGECSSLYFVGFYAETISGEQSAFSSDFGTGINSGIEVIGNIYANPELLTT